jgi:hypothetical protein
MELQVIRLSSHGPGRWREENWNDGEMEGTILGLTILGLAADTC